MINSSNLLCRSIYLNLERLFGGCGSQLYPVIGKYLLHAGITLCFLIPGRSGDSDLWGVLNFCMGVFF